jgi:hypothetical protein
MPLKTVRSHVYAGICHKHVPVPVDMIQERDIIPKLKLQCCDHDIGKLAIDELRTPINGVKIPRGIH